MPAGPRTNDHSIVAGTFSTIATYNAATPSVLTSLPVLADMVQANAGFTLLSGSFYSTTRPGVPVWTAPNAKSVPAKPARVVQYANGQTLGDGYWSFVWQFNFWTDLMFAYFFGTVLGFDLSGQASNGWSIAATAKTYTDPQWLSTIPSGLTLAPAPTPIYMNGYMALPVPGSDYTLVEGGYKDVKVKMSHGTPFTT